MAKTFQGLGPKRRKSCDGDRVYPIISDQIRWCHYYYLLVYVHLFIYLFIISILWWRPGVLMKNQWFWWILMDYDGWKGPAGKTAKMGKNGLRPWYLYVFVGAAGVSAADGLGGGPAPRGGCICNIYIYICIKLCLSLFFSPSLSLSLYIYIHIYLSVYLSIYVSQAQHQHKQTKNGNSEKQSLISNIITMILW